MKFGELFRSLKVVLDFEASSKKDAIEKLVDYLPVEKEKKEMLLNAIMKRESLGSTGIGDGIAVPHARSLIPKDLCIVIGRLKKSVDFESLDGKPVKLIFLIVAPPHDTKNRYLIALGKIAELSREIAHDKKIFEVETEEEFIKELEKLLKKKS